MKAELRKQVLHEMKALSQEKKTGYGSSFNRTLLTSPFYQAKIICQPISPFRMNFKRKDWLSRHWRMAKRFWYPKPIPKGRMDFVVYHPQQLLKTSSGLLEPQGDLEINWNRLRLIWFMFGLGFYKRGIGLDMVEVTTTAIWNICWAYHEYKLSLSSSGA